MKKRTPVLLFLLFSLTIFSQNLEYSAQFYSESYGQRVLSMPNGKWFFAGKIYPGLWEEKEFTVIYGAINQNGGLFPFSPIENRDNSNVLSLFQKQNGNFLIGAEDVECGQALDGVIYEIDDEGEIVVTYELNMTCRDFLDIKSYQGNIYASCAEGISQIFSNGNVVPKVMNVGDISAFIPLYNDWLLVGSSGQPGDFHGVRKLDAQNQILETLDISDGGTIRQMMSMGFDKNVVLQAQNIYLINDNLTVLKDLSVQGINIEFLRCTVDDDHIWVLGRDLDNNIIVYGFDSDLALVENFSVPALGLEALDLAINDDEIALVGTGHSGMYLDTLAGNSGTFVAGSNFWIKTFATTGMSNFSSADVELNHITVDQPTFFDMEYTCDGINMIDGYEAELTGAQIQITNHGNEILNHLVANLHVVACPTSCNYDAETLVQKTYENLNVLPGASIWLPFPDFDAIFHEHDLPQICLWLSTPNNKVDQNPADNVYCKYFFDTTTPMREVFMDLGMTIFPNPVDDILNIKLENAFNENCKVLIMNNLGQILKNEKLAKGMGGLTLKTNELEAGIYFLKIEKADGESQTVRFVKQS